VAAATGSTLTRRGWLRRYRVELAWSVFVAVNTAAILIFSDWATVPFHFVWIGLTLLYGWRVWGPRGTALSLAAVLLLTGVALTVDVVAGHQAADELTEVPLMAVVFVVMVWYVRRAIAARERLALVNEHNLALLDRQRQFVRDASHVLRTPLTIALGHAELVRRTAPDPGTAEDLDVVIIELHRLRHTCDRLLALAATDQPDFLRPVDTRLDLLVRDCWSHWARNRPGVRLGTLVPVTARVDPRHLRDAVDELVSNALRHTPPATTVTLSVRSQGSGVAVAVVDDGPGIAPDERARVFTRFDRAGRRTGRDGFGLGLALVASIAQAHGGRARLADTAGPGCRFEIWLPPARVTHVGATGVPGAEPPPATAAPATARAARAASAPEDDAVRAAPAAGGVSTVTPPAGPAS
jgi:signal transduction histidine kinase